MKKEIEEILKKYAEEPDDIGMHETFITYRAFGLVFELQALLDRAVREERERILKKITPALDDFSNAGQIMIKDGRFVNSGNEMLENVGFIKGEFLSHLTDSEK